MAGELRYPADFEIGARRRRRRCLLCGQALPAPEPAPARSRRAPVTAERRDAVLAAIAALGPGVRNPELAARARVELHDVAAVLGALEADGLIRREGRTSGRRILLQNAAPAPQPKPRPSEKGKWRKPQSAPRQEKERRCLSCGQDFLSSWAGNRICKECKSIVDNRRGGLDDEPVSPVLRRGRP